MEKSSFKLLKLFYDLLTDGIIEFDTLAFVSYVAIMRKSKINAHLKLLMKLGGQILSETKERYIIKFKDLRWIIRKGVLTDLKFGVLLDIVGEPYQYWMWFNKVLNGCKTFIDVGAYIGGYSVRACYRNVNVYAIEANPWNYELLINNLKINCRKQSYNAYNIAAGSKKEIKTLYYGLSQDSFLTSSLVEREGAVVGEKVEVAPLDNIIPSRVERPVLMKIDVEGFEIEVLKGAKHILRNTDFVIIEASKEHKPMIISILRSLGFEMRDRYKAYTFWEKQN